MAVVRPFSCVRPAAEHAAEIAALPYDVYNREEAKREVKSHPLSFLAIDRPETGFPDTYFLSLFQNSARMFDPLCADLGDMEETGKSVLKLYKCAVVL